jgi:chemotaxis-related protein WspB
MLVLTFQVDRDRFALDISQVHEIVPCVRLQPVACSPSWLAGVFNYRGQVVPVIDLHRLVKAGECPVHLSTRIILVPHMFDHQKRLLGLLAARVADVREIQLPALMPTRLASPGHPDPGPVIVDGQEILHLVELDRLLPELSDGKLTLAPQRQLA